VAVSWSKYFVKLLHLMGLQHIPLWLITDTISAKEEALRLGIAAPSFSINLPAGIGLYFFYSIKHSNLNKHAA
jgi:APA family basic amino acid/polyamine antiporter